MTRSAVVVIAVAWLSATALAGSGGAPPAEPVEGGVLQRSGQPKAEPLAQRHGQAVHGANAKGPGRQSDRPALDLSLPSEALASVESEKPATPSLYRGLPGLRDTHRQTDPIHRMRRAFPALLAPQTEDNPVRIKGRLLMDQAKERSPDAVDGGQIIIEVRTE